jgi:hypothetical protein
VLYDIFILYSYNMWKSSTISMKAHIKALGKWLYKCISSTYGVAKPKSVQLY